MHDFLVDFSKKWPEKVLFSIIENCAWEKCGKKLKIQENWVIFVKSIVFGSFRAKTNYFKKASWVLNEIVIFSTYLSLQKYFSN